MYYPKVSNPMIVYISAPTNYYHWFGLQIHLRVVEVVVDEEVPVGEVDEEVVAEVDEVGHHQEVEEDVEVLVDDHRVEGFPVVDEVGLVAVEAVDDPLVVEEEVEGVHNKNISVGVTLQFNFKWKILSAEVRFLHRMRVAVR